MLPGETMDQQYTNGLNLATKENAVIGEDSIPGLKDVCDAQRAQYLANYRRHAVGISRTEMVDQYTQSASNGTYEQELSLELYHGPMIAADFVERYAADRSSLVLDVAAGTGYVGQQLRARGYTCQDALEPSSGMRQIAQTKSVYNTFYSDLLSDSPSSVPTDKYDVLVLSGGMGEGHIPTEALHDMHRMVKPGGHVIIVMREEYLHYVAEYRDRLEPLISKMAAAGSWQIMERTVVPKYSFNKNGVVFVLKVN